MISAQKADTASSPGPTRGYTYLRQHLVAVITGSLLLVVILATAIMRGYLGAQKSDVPKAASGDLCPAQPLRVQLSSGSVLGRRITIRTPRTLELRAFLRVPFAESTEGQGRYRKPRPLKKFAGGFSNATAHGLPCPQTPSRVPLPEGPTSEDCLHFAIWTPGVCARDDPLRPVLVVLLDEWFERGRNSAAEVDGAYLAALGDLVVAVPNHRLGPFGFLNAPGGVANAALHDVLLALTWIRDNIESFHGDPKNVTLLSHNTGAVLTTLLLLVADGLAPFTRRLVLLGTVATTWLPDNNEEKGRESFFFLAGAAGCHNMDAEEALNCLRNASAESVIEAASLTSLPLRFVPSHGGALLNRSARDAVQEDRSYEKLQVFAGSTTHDADGLFLKYDFANLETTRTFVGGQRSPSQNVQDSEQVAIPSMDTSRIIENLMTVFSIASDPTMPLDIFPLEESYNFQSTGVSGVRDMAADLLFACPLLSLLRRLYRGGALVFHCVLRNRKKSDTEKDPVSDHLVLLSGMPFTDSERTSEAGLAYGLIHAVAEFAKAGRPSLPDHRPWPVYGDTNVSLVFHGDRQPDVVQSWRSKQCETLRHVFGGG